MLLPASDIVRLTADGCMVALDVELDHCYSYCGATIVATEVGGLHSASCLEEPPATQKV